MKFSVAYVEYIVHIIPLQTSQQALLYMRKIYEFREGKQRN